MYDFSNSEELRSFFNINPELEPSQRFILHNREEVTFFETMLNKHVETETHLGATDKPCGEGVRTLTQNCC